ncbi:hypothetical protein SteCoe_28572 [Stentor coeruleus]|uniref:Methyltransferase type 11 domain-containing protein n=1 Tax=Stentor coeruleus TaxID=5963 RepID=A0A1R2B8G6_9CILI|nr:hypothetical protein SteCoe_28572 [Stentor coeruleus]
MIEFCLWLVIVVIITAISVIAIPILIITSPLWASTLLVIYLLLKALGLSSIVSNKCSQIYDWLFFKSDKPRKFLWRNFYNALCYMFPQEEWKTMNYGYAVSSETGYMIVLAKEEESERFSYQLYHFMATGFKKTGNLQGQIIVEVGSGRGGGLAYVVRNLKPLSALGVDYSKQQVEFCKRTYTYPNISFVEGDAENLPIKDDSVDMVLNVESCHCYGNFKKFVGEISRVLKSDGRFMLTDFIVADRVPAFEAVLKEFFDISEKKDITPNVLLSLKFDSDRRMELIQNRTPICCRRLLKRFSGSEGSAIYLELESRRSLYLAYNLVKKSS